MVVIFWEGLFMVTVPDDQEVTVVQARIAVWLKYPTFPSPYSYRHTPCCDGGGKWKVMPKRLGREAPRIPFIGRSGVIPADD